MTNALGTHEIETTRFTMGAKVSCQDGRCGEVTRVIIDPISCSLTHLVVDPRQGHRVGRLVPIALVEQSSERIELGCSLAGFDNLEPAEESEFLPPTGDYGGYGAAHVLLWPYYRFGGMAIGMSGYGPNYPVVPEPVIHDAVPSGEVTVRRGDPVHATDGDIGRVAGLVVDTATHHVTHILLEEGHLWGRKDVVIPIRVINRVDTIVEVAMTREQLSELPVGDLQRPGANETESSTS